MAGHLNVAKMQKTIYVYFEDAEFMKLHPSALRGAETTFHAPFFIHRCLHHVCYKPKMKPPQVSEREQEQEVCFHRVIIHDAGKPFCSSNNAAGIHFRYSFYSSTIFDQHRL